MKNTTATFTARHRFRLARMGAAAALMIVTTGMVAINGTHAQTISTYNSNSSNSWLTTANWTNGTPAATNSIALFNGQTQSTIGINLNGTTNNGANNQAVGAISIGSAQAAFALGNSSTTANGTLTLNGTTVNSVANVVLRNASTSTFTIQNAVGSGNKTMSVALGNTTNNIVSADSSGNVAISSNITGGSTNPLTVSSAGPGAVVLTGGNTFSGSTLISSGTLTAGAANALQSTNRITVNTSGTLLLAGTGDRIGNAVPVTLNGGTFNTGGLSENGGATKGPGVTPGVGALTLAANSVIDLANGASILAFANSSALAASWTGTLSIWNWSGNGTIGNGTDELFFGTDSTGLTTAQLAQIQFYSGAGTGALGTTLILSDGEVVPVPEPATVAAGLLALGTLGWSQRRRLGAFGSARRRLLPAA